jgi:hypothetical protein
LQQVFPVSQARRQVPQFASSLKMLVQTPSQQTWLPVQTFPHVPQLASLPCRSMQALPQLVHPRGQQMPFEQT